MFCPFFRFNTFLEIGILRQLELTKYSCFSICSVRSFIEFGILGNLIIGIYSSKVRWSLNAGTTLSLKTHYDLSHETWHYGNPISCTTGQAGSYSPSHSLSQ